MLIGQVILEQLNFPQLVLLLPSGTLIRDAINIIVTKNMQ